MPNLAMRQPGTQFSADGLDLSWPIGGERDVVSVPDEDLTLRVRRRIAEGQIVITDDAATKSEGSGAREYRLLTGEEARARMAEPAGPVTRVVFQPATPEDERWVQEIKSLDTNSDAQREAAEERAKVAEEDYAALVQRQVEAEKKAAAEADSKEDEDEDEDPLDLGARLRRTEEKNAAWFAEREKLFMEKETERQKDEADMLKAFDAKSKKAAKSEGGPTRADKTVMAREKNREVAEKALEAKRQKEAKAAEKDATPGEPFAGKSDPYVAPPTTGAKSAPSSRPTAIAKAEAANTPKAEKPATNPESKPTVAPKPEPKVDDTTTPTKETAPAPESKS